MKVIKAVVRPNKVKAIKDAVTACHVAGMTAIEVHGHGHQRGHSAVYRGREYEVSLLPKMKIETVVPDDRVEGVIGVIMSTTQTGEIGDGRVFVIPVEESRNIHAGERDVV